MVNNFGGEKKAPTLREKCFSPQWDALKELKICLQSGTKITDRIISELQGKTTQI